MARTRTIEPWALDVLASATIEGRVLRLPGQLSREDYTKINKVLTGLGGKWDRKAGGHVFPFDPSELMAGAANDGVYVDRKQALQFFETPLTLAERMAEMAQVNAFGSEVLEPSAGHGRLVDAIERRGGDVTAVEIDPDNAEVLRGRTTATVQCDDFLDYAADVHGQISFDAVVMNPPFTNGQDIAHIRAAWGLLRQNGRLVAICSEGPFFREGRADREFRDWLEASGITSERLPEGTFKESGTGVSARLLFGQKPAV